MIVHLGLFYNSVGLLGSVLILIYCLVQVFDPKIKEGLAGCFIYLCISTCCIAAIIHMLQGIHPPRTVNTLLAFVGLGMMRRLLLATPSWQKIRMRWFMLVKRARAHNRSR